MVWTMWWRGAVAATAIGGIGAAVVAWRFLPFWAPHAWTDEPGRLARALAVEPGMRVADVGAGTASPRRSGGVRDLICGARCVREGELRSSTSPQGTSGSTAAITACDPTP